MQGKDKNGQLLRLGDFVKAQPNSKHFATPLIGRIRSYAASGRILVYFPMVNWDGDHVWLDPVEVELVYHPEPPENPADAPKSEKTAKKPSKVAV